jgi:hypothetical protein
MQRPSTKELYKKLREAKAAVKKGMVLLLDQEVIACDAIELGYVVDDELMEVVSALLEEATPGHYAGSRPPQKSYEKEIKGLELFALKINSSRFRCKVYFKFTLSGDYLWIVSLHRHRE